MAIAALDEQSFDLLTERVLGAIFEVSNTLGSGFLEKVYTRALLRELGLRGIRTIGQASFTLRYKGHPVGEYFADTLVEDVLVIELTCRATGRRTHRAISQLFAGLEPNSMSASQFSKAKSRMETYRKWVSTLRAV